MLFGSIAESLRRLNGPRRSSPILSRVPAPPEFLPACPEKIPPVVRRYPLDPTPTDHDGPAGAYGGRAAAARRNGRESLGDQLAAAAAGALLGYLEWRARRPDLSQLLATIMLVTLGLGLVASAALTDRYLHRGVESGSEMPYVVQPSGRELATNADLRIFTPEDLTGVAATLGDAGFGYVRQKFSWAQIEPSQGTFDWSQYDEIVDQLDRQGIVVIAVVVGAPDWAAAADLVASNHRPPADPEDLARFMQALTARFGAKVPYVQIWDRPNLASEWGGKPAAGATFLPYLAAAFSGARAGNPEVRVITPELALTPDVAEGMGDLAFLEALYRADSSEYFDIVGMPLDGGTISPDDRRVGSDRVSFSRAILYRELMLRYDDGATPVWATTFGWAAGGEVSRDEQAEYVVRGLERAWSEWPWMGLMFQWAFATEPDDPLSAYAVAPDGASTPLYRRLTAPELRERSDLANTGFAPMNADAVTYQGNWEDQHLEGRTFRTTNQVGSSATLRFQGTGLIAFLRSGPQSGTFQVEIDGRVIPGGAPTNDDYWSFYVSYRTDDLPRRLVSGLDDAEHVARITLVEPGELTLGGLVVEREAPFVWPVILLTISSVLVLFLGVRSFIYLVAFRTGWLRRKFDAATPVLPRMPDWRPVRRV